MVSLVLAQPLAADRPRDSGSFEYRRCMARFVGVLVLTVYLIFAMALHLLPSQVT